MHGWCGDGTVPAQAGKVLTPCCTNKTARWAVLFVQPVLWAGSCDGDEETGRRSVAFARKWMLAGSSAWVKHARAAPCYIPAPVALLPF
ncbi:hypothetical protein GCM10027296_40510 [Chitinimonas naiadis]